MIVKRLISASFSLSRSLLIHVRVSAAYMVEAALEVLFKVIPHLRYSDNLNQRFPHET
jgi:hypothetical protein